MNNRFIISIFISMFTLVGFTDASKKKQHVNIAEVLCDKIDVKLYKKHGLVVFGSGGRFINSVQELFRSYQSPESVTLPESRKIAIDCYLEMTNTINRNTEIRPFLEKYPLTSHEIELDIVFTNPITNEHYASPSMAFISIYNDKIKYYASPQPHLPYELVKTESLEIALELTKEHHEK